MKLTVGEKIALLRKERNITQTQLAEYLFLAPQAVSRWEAGGGAPEITLLPRIAAFFGVSIDELFGLTSMERTEELVRYFSVLDIRQEYEAILAETEGLARDLLFPPSRENLSVWLEVVNAAAKIGSKELIGKYLPPVRELCGSQEEIDLLMCLLDVYEGGELEGVKRRVRELLPRAALNGYFEDKIREKLGDIRPRDISKA